MPNRFPLYADADVHQPVIDGLRARGWDVVRAIDVFPEGTADDVLGDKLHRELVERLT